MFLNYEFRVLLVIFSDFWFLAVSIISVSAGWFNFRIRKRRCKSYRLLNVQREVYKWRVLEKLGC